MADSVLGLKPRETDPLRKKAFETVLGGKTTPYSRGISTKREMPGGFDKSEEELKKQYALMKQQAGARFGEAGRQLEGGLERLQARTGRTGGESFGKALETGTAALGREQASLEAGIGAQESAALQALQGEKRGFEERAIDRQRQSEQIKATLQFQENSFANNMALEWAGMDLNDRITMFNAAAAAKQVGLDSLSDWHKVLQPYFQDIFPATKNIADPRVEVNN